MPGDWVERLVLDEDRVGVELLPRAMVVGPFGIWQGFRTRRFVAVGGNPFLSTFGS